MGLYDGGSSAGAAPTGGGGLYSQGAAAAPGMTDEQKKQIAQQALDAKLSGDTNPWDSIGTAIAGVPRAALAIGEEAGKIARLPATVLANVVARQSKEDINNNPILRNITLPEIIPQGQEQANLKSGFERSQDVLPVTNAVVRGAGQTAAELDPRGGFANLRRNYSRDPVGAGLNDAANIGALFTGGASVAGKGAEVLDSAGLASAAAKAEKVGSAATKIATLPFKPYQLAAKVPSLLGERALAGYQDAVIAGERPTLFQTAATKLAPVAQKVSREIFNTKSYEAGAREEAAGLGVAIHDIIPDKAEQAAIFPVVEGTAPLLAQVRASLPKEAFDSYIADHYQGSLTPDAANLAADVAEGKAPALAARIDQVKALDKPYQDTYLTAHPQQGGYAPLDQAKDAGELSNAPSRLEPILGESRAAVDHLSGMATDLKGRGLDDAAAQVQAAIDQITPSTTLSGLEAGGIDAQYLPHTQEGRAQKGLGMRRNPALPADRTPSGERLRTGSPVYDRTVEGIVRGRQEMLVAQARREGIARIAAIPGVVDHLGEGRLAGATNLNDALNLGEVPWNPKTLFDTQGRVRPFEDQVAQAAKDGTEPTMFMQRAMFDQFRNYFEPSTRGQTLGLATDIPNRAYYLGRLAFSPAYVVGRLGHAMLAAAGTSDFKLFGHNLLDTIKSVRQESGGFLNAAKEGAVFPEEVHPRMLKSGTNTATLAQLEGDSTKSGLLNKINQGLNTASRPAFHFAGFLDNMSRSAFYLTELEKRGGNVDAALEASLRAVGEFDKFTPFERDYMRRWFPMYGWHREITKISLRLPVDNPMRVAWTLHLGNSLGKPDSALPSFYDGSVNLGPFTVGTGMINPFAQVPSEFKGTALGAVKNLSPALKIAVVSAPGGTGENPATGKPFSRPGQHTGPPTAPSLFKQVTDIFPQWKAAEAATGNAGTASYSTGDEIKVDQPMTPAQRTAYIAQWHKDNPGKGRKVAFPKMTIPTGQNGPLAAFSGLFGLPVYDTAAITQAANDTAARQAVSSMPKVPKASAGKKGGLYGK